MATQSGITVHGPNRPYTITNDIPRSTPGPKQALVKVLAVGLNPVDPTQQHTGLLVKEWPAILGSDCAGVIIEVGPDCTKLQPGDYVYGCAPLGQNKFTPFQETFLVNEDVFFKKSPGLSVEDGCTIGAGLLTSALCLLAGVGFEMPENEVNAPQKDEWIVILGGTGTVGQFAVQLARVCGYKVLASCSPSKQSVALRNGALATFNNRGSIDEQLSEIKRITGGNFARMFDSTAVSYKIMVEALQTCSVSTTKYLASVDNWSRFNTPSTIKEYRVDFGDLCRLDVPNGVEVTKNIASWIPRLEAYLEAGTLKPIEYQLVDGLGWEKVIQGIHDLENGKAAKKIVVRVQSE
ncbi:chaperonin 10-like protein [Ilyonectria sp. MPI-CAGE-AT-0026]|nr:chaperonin 10-like protein [Ilyonectria sp. MPI-CAGE-AT-0026]